MVGKLMKDKSNEGNLQVCVFHRYSSPYGNERWSENRFKVFPENCEVDAGIEGSLHLDKFYMSFKILWCLRKTSLFANKSFSF
jgi:hypothetical protein